MSSRFRGLFSCTLQLSLVVLFGSLGYILYTVYHNEGISSGTANVFSTVVLVVITAWYARSTHKLLKVTDAQTKATKATYAPKIDSDIEWDDNRISLDISNRGLGVAKDIEIEVSLFTNEMGKHESGDAYRYIAHLKESLPPGKKIVSDNNDNSITLEPRFFVEKADPELRDYVSRHGHDYYEPLVESGFIDEDTMNYLIDRIEQGRGGAESLPSEGMNLDELITSFQEEHGNHPYPIIYVNIEYRDVVGDKTYSEKVVDGARAFPQYNQNDDNDIAYIRILPMATGWRLWLWRRSISRFSELMPIKDIAYPFEEDVSGTVIDES